MPALLKRMNNNESMEGDLNSISKINQSRDIYYEEPNEGPFSVQPSNTNASSTKEMLDKVDPL